MYSFYESVSANFPFTLVYCIARGVLLRIYRVHTMVMVNEVINDYRGKTPILAK